MGKTRKIKKIVKAVLILGLLIAGISFITSPRKVTNKEFIEQTLDTADNSNYMEQKELLAELVEKYYNCTPEKVVFFLTSSNNYQLELYYKDKDSEEWYKTRLGWLSPKISRELDSLLIQAAFH